MLMSESMERTLGRIEEKVNGIAADFADTKAAYVTLAARTTSLERWQSKLVGGAAVAGFIIGIAIQFIKH